MRLNVNAVICLGEYFVPCKWAASAIDAAGAPLLFQVRGRRVPLILHALAGRHVVVHFILVGPSRR